MINDTQELEASPKHKQKKLKREKQSDNGWGLGGHKTTSNSKRDKIFISFEG